MGLIDSIIDRIPTVQTKGAWGAEFVSAQQLSTTLDEATEVLFGRSSTSTTRTYRLPSVNEALGVPSIHRAVALISSTAGMLSMQGYQNGALMDTPPRLIVRPDPYNTPQAFYGGTAAQMAKYGEFVWYIANRDGDNLASALVLVPLAELQVQDNPDDRLRPAYRWGTINSIRYSPATPEGKFVHVKYPLAEPLDLRGKGPLQLCNVASSISVEAQAWAAQFYAEGGNPSVIIKWAEFLSPTEDADGYSEADRVRNQWVNKPHNVPRVIDPHVDSVDYKDVNTASAQMLEARMHQKGDSAEMFGIPGSLLEYQQPGSTLTYQNLEGEFTKFIKVCEQPLYLEPIEQALSDLLPRTTVARFNVEGYLRADVKTRYEVHGIAIDKGIYGPEYAQRKEGILPGDVEFAPVPFSPPQATPITIPRAASLELRDVRCPSCKRLLIRAAGAVEGVCRHCKTRVAA